MKNTYQFKYNQSNTETSQPVLSTRRGSQTTSTQYNSRIGNNPQQNKGYQIKTDSSQRNIFNKNTQQKELLSLSPENKSYQKTEGRKTLRSCFKKKRKKTVPKKATDEKSELKININEPKVNNLVPAVESESKKNINIIPANRGINKEATSPQKNNFDTYTNKYTSNLDKTANKIQSKYSTNENSSKTERKQYNYESKIQDNNNYGNQNKNKYEIKNNYDNKSKSNYGSRNKYEIKIDNNNKIKNGNEVTNINNNDKRVNTYNYEITNINKSKYDPIPKPQSNYQTSKN